MDFRNVCGTDFLTVDKQVGMCMGRKNGSIGPGQVAAGNPMARRQALNCPR